MKNWLKIISSLLLSAFILYWIYRDFPFDTIGPTLAGGIGWGWVALVVVLGIAAQVFRALRWHEALSSIGEPCRRTTLLYSVFISFAASLLIPRIGELSRCATVRKKDGVSFTRSFGCVVSERVVDSVFLFTLAAITLLCERDRFMSFLATAGFDPTRFLPKSTDGDWRVYLPVLVAIIAVVVLGGISRLLRRNGAVQRVLTNFRDGLLSVRHLQHPWRYILYSALICVSNLFNFWLAFYAFPITEHLGAGAGLLAFSMIAVAFIVPTPHGAGPWHFAVKTALIVFGISATDAALFALLVHTVQVTTIALLGIFGLFMIRKIKTKESLDV